MNREELLAACAELAAVAGPSVSIVRGLDLLGESARAHAYAREVAILETEVLSGMLRDGLSSDVVTDRFARVFYVHTLAGDKPALRRYEQALRMFWKQTLVRKGEATSRLPATAQNLLFCAILLDKSDLADEASQHLPDGPWRDLARAWAKNDRIALRQLEQRLADDIKAEENSGDLDILSDGWSYVLLDRIRRRATAGAERQGIPDGR